MHTWLVQATERARELVLTRGRAAADSDQGDVPGWVMVTLMSAALAIALLAIAMPKLSKMLGDALDAVVPGN